MSSLGELADNDLEPGIHYNIPFDEYLKIERMNPSTLVHGCHSMRRLKRYIDGEGSESTPAQTFGTGIHSLAFDSAEQFMAKYCVMPPFENDPLNLDAKGKVPKSPKATKWYKERVAAFKSQSDKIILPEDDFNKAVKMIRSIREHHRAGPLMAKGAKEVTLIGEIDGVPFKGRVDMINDFIIDLKSCNSATPQTFGNWCARLHYPFKVSIYRELLRQHVGANLPVRIVAAESRDDFDVVVYPLEVQHLDEAFFEVRRTIAKYKRCLETNVWPGLDEGKDELDLYVPNWAMPEVDDLLDWEEDAA